MSTSCSKQAASALSTAPPASTTQARAASAERARAQAGEEQQAAQDTAAAGKVFGEHRAHGTPPCGHGPAVRAGTSRQTGRGRCGALARRVKKGSRPQALPLFAFEM